MKESELLKKIQLRATEMGARLFRNNVGKTWTGLSVLISKEETYRLFPGDVVIRKARRFIAGLDKGSSDLIGWVPVKITEDMVGQTFAIFFAVEGKIGKLKTTPEQESFIGAVNHSGGRAVVIRDDLEIVSEIESIKINAGGKL